MSSPTPPAGPSGGEPAGQNPGGSAPGSTEPGQNGAAGGSGAGAPQNGAQGANEGANGGQNGQGGGGNDQRPPWEREGVPFDPDSAWRAILNARETQRAAQARATAAESKVSERERADMTAQQQAEHDRDTFKGERDDARAKLARYEVGLEKGVPAEALDYLQGTTKEELAASADKLLALLGSSGQNAGGSAPAGGRPRERFAAPPPGGADPNTPAVELDPEKLAGQVPRGF